MSDNPGSCTNCNGLLVEIDAVEIDAYGEMLEGCPRCNLWGAPGSDRRWHKLPDEDIEALRGLRPRLRAV